MKQEWKIAAASGLGGAVIAVAVVYAAAVSGFLPVRNDAAMHDYLMAHPGIIYAMQDKAQQDQAEADDRASQEAVNKLGLNAFFDPRVAFISGPAKAKTSVVEFFDYNCPYCRASLPALKKFYAQHRADTRFAFIEFPFKGPDSTFATRVALAARKQGDKYLAFHFLVMGEENQTNADTVLADAQKAGLDMNKLAADMKSPTIDLEIAQSKALADAAKVSGTPFFIVNGKIRAGAVDDKTLKEMAKG